MSAISIAVVISQLSRSLIFFDILSSRSLTVTSNGQFGGMSGGERASSDSSIPSSSSSTSSMSASTSTLDTPSSTASDSATSSSTSPTSVDETSTHAQSTPKSPKDQPHEASRTASHKSPAERQPLPPEQTKPRKPPKPRTPAKTLAKCRKDLQNRFNGLFCQYRHIPSPPFPVPHKPVKPDWDPAQADQETLHQYKIFEQRLSRTRVAAGVTWNWGYFRKAARGKFKRDANKVVWRLRRRWRRDVMGKMEEEIRGLMEKYKPEVKRFKKLDEILKVEGSERMMGLRRRVVDRELWSKLQKEWQMERRKGLQEKM